MALFLMGSLQFLSAQTNKVEIRGKVLEQSSNQPLEFATVMIGDAQSRTSITGTTTDLDGNFRVFTESTDFYVQISYTGFADYTIVCLVSTATVASGAGGANAKVSCGA